MTGSAQVRLVGVADPAQRAMGFLIPVFTRERSNALLVQKLAADGRIASFEALDPQEVPLVAVPERPCSENEPALWAFAFKADDIIVGNGDEERDELESRLDDPLFVDRPMLGVEVTQFLGSPRRLEFACATYVRLCKVARSSADRWRDLSILTSDVRNALRQQLEKEEAKTTRSAVATVQGNVVLVRGISSALGRTHRQAIIDITKGTLKQLGSLYEEPKDGWSVRLSGDQIISGDIAAAVLIGDQSLTPLVEELRLLGVPSIQPFGPDQASEFHRLLADASLPGFVVTRNIASGQWHQIATTARIPPSVIELVARSGEWVGRRRHLLDNPGITVITVPVTGIARPSSDFQREAASLQHAIAAVLAAESLPRPVVATSNQVVFLRARGRGHDPSTDAWTSLYDRAWSSGLSPEHSTRLAPSDRRSEGHHRNWAAEALFGDTPVLTHSILDRVFTSSRTDAALLVAQTGEVRRDLRRHRASVSRLLSSQGWDVDDLDPGRDHTRFTIKGERANFVISVEESDPRRPKWDLSKLRNRQFKEIGQLSVTCAAHTSAILAKLQTGELPVNVRDLGRLPSNRSTIYTILATQLQRMVVGLASRARSHFLALLITDAFGQRTIALEDGGSILDAATGQTIGDQVHFLARRVRTAESFVEVDIQLIASSTNEYARKGDVLAAPFKMLVHDSGIELRQ
jgi:hypothetical protein